MKKTLIIALALLAGASFTANAADKKKKQKTAATAQPVEAPVVLATGSDSLSYAAGMMVTNGLTSVLRQQFGVDTAYMADFVSAFRETVAETADGAVKARRAGQQIAFQLVNSLLPRMKSDFADTPDTIVNAMLFRGFADAMMGDTTVMKADATPAFVSEKQAYNQQARVASLSQAGRDFLAANATQPGVITTPSGLQYKVLVQGDGPVPQATDRVRVNYEGRLIDGTVFDASSKHGNEPSTFRADQVISGWTEALTMMPVGSKWQLFIPQELAYGERSMGLIPAYAALVFDVELVAIEQ